MKKKVLFIMNNLNCGGAEKALISLLEVMDYSKYEVDLYLFKKEGIFLKQVPDEVNILNAPVNYPFFDMSIKRAIIENFLKLKLKVVFYRILVGLVYKSEATKVIAEQKAWKYLKHVLKPLRKSYDVAIGYLEKTPVYFCVDKVRAPRKIGFIHNDFIELKMDASREKYFFNKLDCIVTVSLSCKSTLDKVFGNYVDKISVMYNIVSKDAIKRLSTEAHELCNSSLNIISVGRLNKQKGFDLAIEACKILVDRGMNVKWCVLGEGEERMSLESTIKEYGLEKDFILLGNKENPYPYIKKSDIIAQTSRYEGKSVVLDEAKILCKPIVVTNYPTVKDQITHLEDGYIVEIKPENIANGIQEMIENKELSRSLVDNLNCKDFGTEYEVEKLYKLINETD